MPKEPKNNRVSKEKQQDIINTTKLKHYKPSTATVKLTYEKH